MWIESLAISARLSERDGDSNSLASYRSLCLCHAEKGGIEVGEVLLEEEAPFDVGLGPS